MRVKRLVSLALAGMLAASVALTGCGSKKEATTSDGKTIVKIGTQQMPNDEGIAKAMNYFQEEWVTASAWKSWNLVPAKM